MTKLDKEIQEGLYDPTIGKFETLYRGESMVSKKGGKYWSPDINFALQFTQSGQHKEVSKANIKTSDIYTTKELPYAGDPDAIDKAVIYAKNKGYSAIRLSEGKNNPDTVFVFDKRALKSVSKLYDSKSHQKTWEKELKAKAHEGKKLKGQQKLTSAVSTSKRLREFAFDIKGIADSLRRQGIEPDLIDIEAEYDHSLSHKENLAHIKKLIAGKKIKATEKHILDNPACSEVKEIKEHLKKIEEKTGITGLKTNLKDAKIRCDCSQCEQMGLYDLSVVPAIAYGLLTGHYLNLYDLKPKYKIGDMVYSYQNPDIKAPIVRVIESNDLGYPHKYILRISTGGGGTKNSKWISEPSIFRSRQTRYYDSVPLALPTRWYEAMVRAIKKSSDVRNPYAIVKSIWSKLSPSKKTEIKARESKGEIFKYDLPLPVDKPTKGTGTVRMVKPFKLAEVQVNLSVKDYLSALKSGLFSRMKRGDGTTALVARCKAKTPQDKNVNIFVDKARK